MCDDGEIQKQVVEGTNTWMRIMSDRINDLEAQVEILMSMNISIPHQTINIM
jgi:hypothetical protein